MKGTSPYFSLGQLLESEASPSQRSPYSDSLQTLPRNGSPVSPISCVGHYLATAFQSVYSCRFGATLMPAYPDLFLAAAQENIWNITGPSMNDLNATYLDPPLPGRLPIQRWVALGDSFSAGPGAGCQIKGSPNNCKRNDGAYAPQMQASETFKNSYKNPDWLFQACTGDTILPVSLIRVPWNCFVFQIMHKVKTDFRLAQLR